MIEFAASFERAKDKLKKFTIPFLDNYTYEYIDGKDFLYINDSKKSMGLSEISSGLQTLIPLLLVIEVDTLFNGNIDNAFTYVIEEPELNLYPETQYALLKYLAKSIIKKSPFNDFIITTHSPYILAGANNLLLASKVNNNDDEIEFASIDSSKFGAYTIRDGKSKLLVDLETGLISENELDSASEFILNDFEYLMNFKKDSE